MTPYPKVIITGCALEIPAEGKALWGDLWQQGPNCFIFNGVCHGFDAGWLYGDEANILCGQSNKVVAVNGPYFERKGVIVFPSEFAEFNMTAQEYLSRNPDFIKEPK